MTTTAAAPRTGYAPVNGLRMYYELHGSGGGSGQPPLILLHGAFSAIGTSFGKVLPGLAATRQVIGVELQAHGRTADIDRPLSVEQMAEDTAALLRYLKLERADVFGYSTGGPSPCGSSCATPRWYASRCWPPSPPTAPASTPGSSRDWGR